MFDQFESFYRPKRSGWIRLAIGASVVAHLAFAGALVINAAWKINKLQLQDAQLTMAAFGLPQASPPALKAETREKRVKKPIKRTTDLTQQDDATENREVKAGGGNDGTADGDPDGKGDSQGNTIGAPIGALCPNGKCLSNIEPPKNPGKAPPAREPTIVDQSKVKHLLKSGNTQIHPSANTKTAILRSGDQKVIGIVRTCISTSGRVTSAKLLRSTGYPAYDRKLVAGVRRLVYSAFKVNGRPIPVCTALQFIYKLERR